MPVGRINPNFQASKMQANKNMDTPTRKAKALAIRLDWTEPPLPPRSMNHKARARLARMAKNARLTR